MLNAIVIKYIHIISLIFIKGSNFLNQSASTDRFYPPPGHDIQLRACEILSRQLLLGILLFYVATRLVRVYFNSSTSRPCYVQFFRRYLYKFVMIDDLKY